MRRTLSTSWHRLPSSIKTVSAADAHLYLSHLPAHRQPMRHQSRLQTPDLVSLSERLGRVDITSRTPRCNPIHSAEVLSGNSWVLCPFGSTVPQLECYVQFWSSYDREGLERVQKSFTGTMPGLEGISCTERMDTLGLISLAHRRLRGDLVELYMYGKIL